MKKQWCLLMCLILLAVGCTHISPSPSGTQPVHHIVVVWLKPEFQTPEYRRVLQEETEKLASIPGIIRLHQGVAIASERPIVDASFDLAVSMVFADVKSMNAYLTHPKHQEFVQRYVAGKAEKLTVYDF